MIPIGCEQERDAQAGTREQLLTLSPLQVSFVFESAAKPVSTACRHALLQASSAHQTSVSAGTAGHP